MILVRHLSTAAVHGLTFEQGLTACAACWTVLMHPLDADGGLHEQDSDPDARNRTCWYVDSVTVVVRSADMLGHSCK